jgi:hypothetical protein
MTSPSPRATLAAALRTVAASPADIADRVGADMRGAILRARAGKPINAGAYLALCGALGLDPVDRDCAAEDRYRSFSSHPSRVDSSYARGSYQWAPSDWRAQRSADRAGRPYGVGEARGEGGGPATPLLAPRSA